LDSKYDDAHNWLNSLICGSPLETKSPRDKAGTQDGEPRIHTRLWQPATTGHQQCHQKVDNIRLDQTTTIAQPPEQLVPPKLPEASARPEELMNVIDKWFDYQASLQAKTTPNHDRNILTKSGSKHRKGEQPSERQSEKNELKRQAKELDTKEDTGTDKRAICNQFSWQKGFLATHKPSTHPVTSSQIHYDANSIRLQTENIITATHGRNSPIPTIAGSRKELSPMSHNIPTRLDGIRPIAHQFDLRLHISGKIEGEEVTQGVWRAMAQLLTKLQEINPSVVIYPWNKSDHHVHPLIDKPGKILANTSLLELYLPSRQLCQAYSMHHTCMFLGMSLSAPQLLKQIGPWLHVSHQGLWPRQIPRAEQTKCLGWLLYSAPEYNW